MLHIFVVKYFNRNMNLNLEIISAFPLPVFHIFAPIQQYGSHPTHEASLSSSLNSLFHASMSWTLNFWLFFMHGNLLQTLFPKKELANYPAQVDSMLVLCWLHGLIFPQPSISRLLHFSIQFSVFILST